jgi:hypothetical protein
MAMEYVGATRIRQCAQASDFLRRLDCCDSTETLNLSCDVAGLPDFNRWGFQSFHSPNPLDWQAVTDQIKKNMPIVFSWLRKDPAGTSGSIGRISHINLLIGYNTAGTEQTVTYLKPRPFAKTDAVMVPFADYRGTGDYDHEHDYSDIKKAAP